MLMLAAPLLSLLVAQAPTVGLAFGPAVGLSESELEGLRERVTDEVTAGGVSVVEASSVDPSCVANPGCLEGERTTVHADLDALLLVEFVRVGPVVQLTATGAAESAQVSASHGLGEEQLGSGPLLPAEAISWLGALAPPATAPPAEPAPSPSTPAPSLPSTAETELSPLRSAGLFMGGLGALGVAAASAMVIVSEPVLADPTTSGAEKEAAVALGWAGVAIGAVGFGAVAGGAALWLLE